MSRLSPLPNSISQGVAITVAMRWTDRLIGLFSTLILARLLAPEDFGIIAMASLVIGLVDVLLDMGVHVSLIQNQQANQAHFNSAWTLKVLQSLAVAAVLMIGAPWVAHYFNSPDVELVVQALAMAQLIAGFENIGVVQFQKEMQFQREFLFRFYRRMIGFCVTMVMAWLLHSYWAMVWGTLAMRLSGVVLSYLMHPMRPRWGTEKMREIFSVSQWMLVGNIGSFLERNLHRMLVGRHGTPAILGGYTLADEVATMPTDELLAPVNRVLFPAFAKAADQPRELRRLFLLALQLQSLVTIPATIGLAMVAPELVVLMLGEKWLFAVPFLQVLAIGNLTVALTGSCGYVLIVLKKIHLNVISNWLAVISFGALALILFDGAEAIVFAYLKLLTSLAFSIGVRFFLLKRFLVGLHYGDLVAAVARPMLAGACMAGALWWLGQNLHTVPSLVLIIKVFAGGFFYGSVVLGLWWASGRAVGGETYLLDKLRGLISRTQ